MTVQQILEGVKNGSISVEEADGLLQQNRFEDMGYAKLDMDRRQRTGFAEVVFCSGKTDAHLLHIFQTLYRENGEVLGTRASEAQYQFLREQLAQLQYDPVSHILK